jgi:UDP-glucose:(heptosyl)LPS alpha-1,3-glucosyltransferase
VVARRCDDVIRTLGATVHIVDIRSPWHFAEAVERLLRSLDLDIVHDMGFGWCFDIFHSHVGSPIVYREQLLQLEPRSRQLIKRLAEMFLPSYHRKRALYQRQFSARSEAVYLALSQMVARDFRSRHNLADENIAVIPNGVDTNKFTPAPDSQTRDQIRRSLRIGDDDILLVLVAHRHRLKGLPTLVEATAQLAGQGDSIHVVVVGGSPSREQQRQIDRLGLSGRIHFVGVVNPIPYYHSADIYVHPTRYDACSLVVLEALASGLPVITTTCNGAGELVTDGVCGYVVKGPATANEIGDRIGRLLNPTTRRSMSIAARATAERHSLENNFQRIVELYHDILQKKRAVGRPHSQEPAKAEKSAA